MAKVYKKSSVNFKKRIIRIVAIFLLVLGPLIFLYIFFPLISWQIYFANSFYSQNVQTPIPKGSIVSQTTIADLIKKAPNISSDLTNAQNWFPNYKFQKNGNSNISFYSISIPKIKIKDAIVSTNDSDLSRHLVNYGGTANPPQKGNSVVFGHSTLPQLYNSKDYKTIFTNLYKLDQGDEIIVSSSNISYIYRVESITVVDPDNTTVLEQNYSDSFITLVTCTPPGTIWKRLVVKARLQKV